MCLSDHKMEGALKFALRLQNPDVVKGTTYSNLQDHLIYKKNLKEELENNLIPTDGYYQGHHEAGDSSKAKKGFIACVQQDDTEDLVYRPDDGRSAVLEEGPASTNSMFMTRI